MAGRVVVGVLVGSPSAAAQEVANGGSTWVGPWHAAMGLAVRLSSDSAAMADILAGAESALALGRWFVVSVYVFGKIFLLSGIAIIAAIEELLGGVLERSR